MNRATTKSLTPWMRIRGPQNLIPTMCTSRPVCNCSEVAKAMGWLAKTVLLCLKMYIHRLTKQREPWVLQDPNGVRIQALSHKHQDHQLDLPVAGEADLQKSTLLRSLLTPLSINENVVRFPLPRGDHPQDPLNR